MLSPANQFEVDHQNGVVSDLELIQIAKEFEKAVHEMRNLQIKYFKTRDPEILSQSKAAEKKVDSLLGRFNYSGQPELF